MWEWLAKATKYTVYSALAIIPLVKTTIVYRKGDGRRGTYPEEHFDFLGYTFRPRRSKKRRAEQWLRRVARRQPGLFSHRRILHVGAGR